MSLAHGRYRGEVRVSFSDAAAGVRARDIEAQVFNFINPNADGSGGMVAQDVTRNPHVVLVQERRHGRVLVTMSFVVDISPTNGWTKNDLAQKIGDALINAHCAGPTSVQALNSALKTSRPASTDAARAPVTTAVFNLTRIGNYPVTSTAHRFWLGGGPPAVPAGTLFDSIGRGGTVAAQALAPIAPAEIPVTERVNLANVLSSSDPAAVGQSEGVVSASTIAEAGRSNGGQLALLGCAVAFALIAVILWKKAT